MTPALALLAEMVTAPNLAEPDIERVRKLRLERLRQLRDHAPAVAERALARVLYRDHPYGHLGLGTEAALEATDARRAARVSRGRVRPRRLDAGDRGRRDRATSCSPPREEAFGGVGARRPTRRRSTGTPAWRRRRSCPNTGWPSSRGRARRSRSCASGTCARRATRRTITRSCC